MAPPQLLGGLQRLRGNGSAGRRASWAPRGGVDQVKDGSRRSAIKAGWRACDALTRRTGDWASGADERPAATQRSAGADGKSQPGARRAADPDANLAPASDRRDVAAARANAALTSRAGCARSRPASPTWSPASRCAVAGAVGPLESGASRRVRRSGELSDGLTLIDGGAGKLADGAGRLGRHPGAAGGASDLADGAGASPTVRATPRRGRRSWPTVRRPWPTAPSPCPTARASSPAARARPATAPASWPTGADELADGLVDAADGSVRLADGLAEAADGAPALVDGAGRLSDEGMSQLIDAGEDTAQDYGKLYATIEAGAERADAEKMAYGAPADARGLTAYTYEMLGDDGETGRNTKRGLAALGLLGLGGGALLLRRRFV